MGQMGLYTNQTRVLLNHSPKKPKERYVAVNENVRERHSSDNSPLKKIHSEGSPVVRRRPVISGSEADSDDDVKEYVKPGERGL